MKRVVKEELDLLVSSKTRKLLKSIKAATLAGAIVISSIHGSVSAKAAQMDSQGDQFVFIDASGNVVNGASAPEAYDTGVKSTGTTSSSDMSIEGEVAEARKSIALSNGTSVEVDSKILGQIEQLTGEEMSSNEEIATGIEKCLPVLEDVPMSAVDDKYIGIAPIGYVGPKHEMKNYGDASNIDEVTERAQKIYGAITEANKIYTKENGGPVIINSLTGNEFTLEEIITIIQFVNGAYAAKSDADVQKTSDLLQEFIAAMASDKYLVEDVAYKSGNTGPDGTVTENDVISHDNILEKVSLFDLLMGDNANGPFIKWMSNKIMEASIETDPVKAGKILDEAFLAIVAIVNGNGFVINGVNYRIDDFDRVNDLALIVEVLISSVEININNCEIGYIYNKEYVGEVVTFLTTILDQFNALCADSLVSALENGGIEYRNGVTRDAQGNPIDIRSYGSVMQMKAIAQALYVGAYGDNYYDSEYLNYYNGPYNSEGSEFGFSR